MRLNLEFLEARENPAGPQVTDPFAPPPPPSNPPPPANPITPDQPVSTTPPAPPTPPPGGPVYANT